MNATPSRGPDLRLVAAVFVIVVGIAVARALFGRAGLPFFEDTDDAMRMVMVRDFIHGQNWYDLTNHRLNTPWGAEIHWSRLIDLPLALLVMAFTPLVGADTAMVAAGYVWPMALLGLLLWLSAGLANRLVGPQGVLPALVLPVISPAVTAEFNPGRVDHHSVIVILTVAMIWSAIEGLTRPRFAALCGVLAATALAIATESLPPIAAAIIVMAMAYVFDPARARSMRAFGLSFALAAVVHLAIFRPPTRWLDPACDVLSPFYVGIALVVGIAFTLASLLPLRSAWLRLLQVGGLGLAGFILVILIYPECLKGPYGGLDPWLQANWIANILEAHPWFVSLSELPAYSVAIGIPALLGTVIVLVRLWRVADDRPAWAVLLVFMVLTTLVMLVQVRGARLAIMPAMPAAAWLIVSARAAYLARPRLPQIFGLILSWLAFAGLIIAMAVTALINAFAGAQPAATQVRAQTQFCLVPSAFADLAALPPERIMTPIDLGAHMLLYTRHEVVSAPYHRNQQGVRDTFRFFNDPIATARAILTERGIGLVVLCPGMPEIDGFGTRAPDSFASLYAADTLPSWLNEVTLPGSPLRVFAVLP